MSKLDAAAVLICCIRCLRAARLSPTYGAEVAHLYNEASSLMRGATTALLGPAAVSSLPLRGFLPEQMRSGLLRSIPQDMALPSRRHSGWPISEPMSSLS